jgi:hypothetical protein
MPEKGEVRGPRAGMPIRPGVGVASWVLVWIITMGSTQIPGFLWLALVPLLGVVRPVLVAVSLSPMRR